MEKHSGFILGWPLLKLETKKRQSVTYIHSCSYSYKLWAFCLFSRSWEWNKTNGLTVKRTSCTFILKGILDNLITHLNIHKGTLPCTRSLTSTDLLIRSPWGSRYIAQELVQVLEQNHWAVSGQQRLFVDSYFTLYCKWLNGSRLNCHSATREVV